MRGDASSTSVVLQTYFLRLLGGKFQIQLNASVINFYGDAIHSTAIIIHHYCM